LFFLKLALWLRQQTVEAEQIPTVIKTNETFLMRGKEPETKKIYKSFNSFSSRVNFINISQAAFPTIDLLVKLGTVLLVKLISPHSYCLSICAWRPLGSISSTLYSKFLYAEIPKAQKYTDNLTEFLHFYDLHV